MLSSSTGADAEGSTDPLRSALTAAEVDEDPNVEVLRVSERIQRLTRATDALIARDFVLREEEAILDDLEAYLGSLESEVKRAESQTEELRSRSSLLRPGKWRAVAGENAEVNALWNEYGETMGRLVKQHALRLAELEKALTAVSTRDPEPLTPKPLPPPPAARPSTTKAVVRDAPT
ncbi:hypothetical protein LSCM1_00376 [Leishmania martiniquensis]|uniref:Uncharacterized protein n=1 Tax=Leishmania martiniquensis TaxID=1580590 RepID=A0A836K8Q0_9TRYP|nr:hypothetical protein LSCM1_00376 [Leishmania martiniquensis]